MIGDCVMRVDPVAKPARAAAAAGAEGSNFATLAGEVASGNDILSGNPQADHTALASHAELTDLR
jgi:hypothetical protein